MKKLVYVISLLMITLFGISPAAAAGTSPTTPLNSEVKLIYNDNEIYLYAAEKPQIINGKTMVPVRTITKIMGAAVHWDEENRAVYIEDPLPITAVADKNIFLYPFQQISGMYEGFILEIKGERSYFAWENMNKPGWEPDLYSCDLNQDGQEEVIVILTLGEGTGCLVNEIHVVDSGNFKEIPVENALNIIKDQVKLSFSAAQVNTILYVNIADKSYRTEFDYTHLFNTPGYGSIVRYGIVNNQICCQVPVQVSPAGFAGDIVIFYAYDSALKTYKPAHIEYMDEGYNA